MNKKVLIFVGAIFLLVLAFGFVSAETCCVKPLEGKWCQDDLPADQCDISTPTPCKLFKGCLTGTGVSENTGECSSNAYKAETEAAGNSWFDEPLASVSVTGVNVCKKGCCFYGESTSLLTFSKCQAVSTALGMRTNFDPTITIESQCLSLSNPNEEVACVFTSSLSRDCTRTTREKCNSLGGDAEAGYLCTASRLATDCAKSGNTICYKGKVYFTDTCNNLANIYDENMFSKNSGNWSEIQEDYWTYIKNPSETDCTIDPNLAFSSSCGNCNEIEGTICRSYNEAKNNEVNSGMIAPKNGNFVCASMDCTHDTNNNNVFDIGESYKHGESWCAETEGIVPHIQITNETGKFLDNTRSLLTNFIPGTSKNGFKQSFSESYNFYNLPGSRYVRLSCVDGTVYEDFCADYREEVCMESTMGASTDNFRVASCVKNNYISCGNYTDKTSCEDGLFCKWIYGYRFDGQNLNSIDDREEEDQGSCIPLFSAGLKIWVSEGEEYPTEAICDSVSFADAIIYETSWTRDRTNFPDKPLCDTSGTDKNFDHTSDCSDKCYMIPTYGRTEAEGDYFSLKELMNLHKGEDIGENLNDACLSDRKSYYCDGKTGEVGGQSPDCAGDGSGKIMPLFFRHDEWILSIKDRARSIGDCGYKPGILMDDLKGLNPDLETIYAIYQIDGGKSYDAQKIYEGDFSPVYTYALA